MHVSFLFYRFGRVQSVKILKQKGGDHHGLDGSTNATVAFMDIKSANKAHGIEHNLEDRLLRTDYYDPSSNSTNASQHYKSSNSITNSSGQNSGSSQTLLSSGSLLGSSSTTTSSSLNSRLHPEDGLGPGPGPGPGGGGSSNVSASDHYNENHSRSSHFSVGDRLGGGSSNNAQGASSIRDRIGERGSSGNSSGSINMLTNSDSFFNTSSSTNVNSSSHRTSNNERRGYGDDDFTSRQRSVRSVGYRSQGYNSDK